MKRYRCGSIALQDFDGLFRCFTHIRICILPKIPQRGQSGFITKLSQHPGRKLTDQGIGIAGAKSIMHKNNPAPLGFESQVDAPQVL